MGERKNTKTSRDTVEEIKPPSAMGESNTWMGKENHSRHHSGNHNKFSASGTTVVPESTDNCGWGPWDSVEEKPTSPTNDGFTKRQSNALDRKEIGARTRHHRDVSPGFKGRHTSNNTIEKDRNDSHRHLERGRSRSRTRGRSRSRSLSRAREKGRKRSRSRGDGSARDRSFPRGDYARKSYGSSDQITAPEKSSQICRNFASGRCMRGSQCRFLHIDDTSRRNEDPIEDHKEGCLRSRVDRDRTSKHTDDIIHKNEYLVEDQKEESWRNRSDSGRSSKHPDDTIRRNEDFVEDQKDESWRNRPDSGRSSKHPSETFHKNEGLVEDQKEDGWRNISDRVGRSSKQPGDVIHRNEDLVEDQKRESWRNQSDRDHTSKHSGETIRRNEGLVENQKEESWRNISDRVGCSSKRPGDTIHRNEDLVEDQKGESWRNRSDRGHTSKNRDDTIRINEDPVEDQKGERWGNRADHDRTSRPSYNRGHGSEPRDDVSGSYHGDEEKFHSRGRKSIPCKDFMSGNCRFGDACRFSHTSGDSFGKGARNASFERDTDCQPKNGPPMCRYFLTGNCGNDDCRFSHEDSKHSSVEGRRGESTHKHSVHDKGNKWDGPALGDGTKNSVIKGDNSSNRENQPSPPRKIRKYGEGRDISESVGRRGDKDSTWNGPKWGGPTWDDAARNAETVSSGWNDAIVTNTASSDDIKNGKHDDRKRGWGGGPGISLNREDKASPPRERGSSRRDRVTSESVGRRGEDRRSEISDKHSLHDKDNTWNGPTQDDAAKNPETMPSGWTETIVIKTTSSDDTRNGKRDDRKREWQSGLDNSRENKSSPPREIRSSRKDRGTNESVGRRGGFTDKANTWNGPTLDEAAKNSEIVASRWDEAIVMTTSVDVNEKCKDMQENWHEDSVNRDDKQEHLISHPSKFQVGFSSFQRETAMHEEQTSIQQNVSPAAHLEQQHLDVLIPNGLNGISIDLNGPGIEITYPSGMQAQVRNHLEAVQSNVPLNIPFAPEPIADQQVAPVTETDPIIINEDSQAYASVEISNSPPPPVVKDFNNFTMEQVRSPKLKQEDVIVDNKAVIGKENNGIQENKVSETVDGKAEENSGNKDDKGTRLFKNALIELVKEILKPKWKEGKMSRDDHKTIVKKSVDKVTSTIASEHVPKTQDKVDLYLLSSKPKISKLVQAYAERCLKKDA